MKKKRAILAALGAVGLGLSALALLCAPCHPALRWTAGMLFAAVGLALIAVALLAGDRYVEDTMKHVTWKDLW